MTSIINKNPNEVKFRFDGNSTEIFHPNSTVCVLIDLILKKPVKSVNTFRIEVTGSEKTKFHDFSHLKDIIFDATHDLFVFSGFLLGGKKTSEPEDMDVGTYSYRYLFQIPREAPSSFNGVNGMVQYKVSTILDSEFAPDFEKEKVFTVFRFEDFNDYMNLRTPVEIESKKIYGFGLSKKLLRVKMAADREGFGKNDKIHIKLEINNNSKLKFPTTYLTFNRIERSQGRNPFLKINKIIKVLGRIKCDAVLPKSNRILKEELHVPLSSPSTNDHLCEIFQISYSVIFSVIPELKKGEKKKLKKLGKDIKAKPALEVDLPVYVGTLGFHEDNQEHESDTFDLQSTPYADKDIRELKHFKS